MCPDALGASGCPGGPKQPKESGSWPAAALGLPRARQHREMGAADSAL